LKENVSNRQTRFGLIRHAQTVWNKAKRIQGHLDSPLTEKGSAQARAWGDELGTYRWDRCICSDLGRAKSTAEIINATIKVPLIDDPRLREQDWGNWSGLTLAQLTDEKAERLAEQTVRGWRFRPEGGENRNSVWDRGRRALESAAAKWPGESILVVTHEGVIKCLVYRLLRRRFLPSETPVLRPAHLHWLMADQSGIVIDKINALALGRGIKVRLR
jgi:probable phosphoglycerate mutase